MMQLVKKVEQKAVEALVLTCTALGAFVLLVAFYLLGVAVFW